MLDRSLLVRSRVLGRQAGRLACTVLAVPVVLIPTLAVASARAEPASRSAHPAPAWIMSHIRDAQPWARVVRNTLADWYASPAGTEVVVGLTRISAAARSAARLAFGGGVELVVAPMPQSAVGTATVSGVSPSTWRPAMPRSRTGSRRADSQPFYGGDEIVSYHETSPGKYSVLYCTSAFDGTDTAHSWNVITTAGHCDATRNYRTWYSGYIADGRLYVGDEVGSVDALVFSNDRADAMTLTRKASSGTYSPHVFVGPITSATNLPVTGSAALSRRSLGERICTDGAIAGAEICGPKIIEVDLCARVVDKATSVSAYVCHLAVAQYSRPFCLPGNSGGPVFLDGGHAHAAVAVGTIEGYGSKGKAYYCYVNQLPNALAAVHSKLSTT